MDIFHLLGSDLPLTGVSTLRVRDSYIRALEALALPVTEEALAAHHEAASAAARQQFQAEKFGNDLTTGLGSLQDMLQASLDKEYL